MLFIRTITVALLLYASTAYGQAPQIMLTWSIANSGTDIGSTRVEMRTGWADFIDDYVVPGMAWADATNVTYDIMVMHPFGQYATQEDDAMHLDGYEYAKAAGATHLTNGFATNTGWRRITSQVDCYAYVGGCHLTDRLRDLPPAQLRAAIQRNLKPFKDAGFKGVYVDWAENAIAHPFTNPNYVDPESPQHLKTRSVDVVTLAIADEMFEDDAGVESPPRNFSVFQPLFYRNCIAQDSIWRHRYGGFTPEQITLYGYGTRNTNYVALGYDRSVLTGDVVRTLDYADDPTTTLALARLIVGEGDIPAFNPLPFILNNVPASAIVE